MDQQKLWQFFYQDWREGWGWSEEESKKLEIYRQGYCGCVLSERDRYQKAPKEIPKQPEEEKMQRL